MMYPHGIDLRSHVGTMCYRGEIITSQFRLEDRSLFKGAARIHPRWFKWYYHHGLGTMSLSGLLDTIDYRKSGTYEKTVELTAMPPGSTLRIGRDVYLKTDVQGEHEAPGNWFVHTVTGKVTHAGDLAARLCHYTPRPERRTVANVWQM